MPNKMSDKRRRVVYIEDKDKWELIKEAAAREGVSPSSLVRIATQQLCEKLKDPKFRVIKPLFE
jgi:hypothetical protein